MLSGFSFAPPRGPQTFEDDRQEVATSPPGSSRPEEEAPSPVESYPAEIETDPLPRNDRSVLAASRREQIDRKVHPGLVAFASGVRARSATTGAERPDGYVAISAVADRSGPRLLRDLLGLGLSDGLVDASTVSGKLPTASIDAATRLASLRYMRPEWTIRSTGAVESQGVKALNADIGRELFGVTGKGVTVGILSDSFDCLEGAAEDVANGELPDDVSVIKEGDCLGGTDEGRAMAQIVADVAPDASLGFRTAMGGPMAMRNGINDFVDAGADVIVDDIHYVDEPWFQEGMIHKAIDAAEASGVTYLSAAGNAGRASYEGPFDDAGVRGLIPGSRAHDFDAGSGVDPLQRITIGAQSFALIELQWSDNFKAQTRGGPAPKSDLDFFAIKGDEVVGFSVMPNIRTLEPFELLLVPNFTDAPMSVELEIERVEGVDPLYIKWVGLIGKMRIDQHATSGATTIGHTQAAGAISVGAAGFKDTPAYGTSPPVLASYSSKGSTPVVLGADGQRLKTAFKRRKPDIVAPDGANTSFFGEDSSLDSDDLPNFRGTSAAAPHAAGVAALLYEKLPKAKAVDICNALSTTAVEMGDKGFDYDSGHGLVDAHAALGWLTKTGKDGVCGAATIDVRIKTPAPEPVETPEPERTPAPPTPVSTPAPPPPTPTPHPALPQLFVDESEVTAGDRVRVSGWFLPRNARFVISLDGESAMGSAQSDPKGRLSATLQVPAAVPDGRYVVTAAGGGHSKLAAARRLVVHGRRVIVLGTSVTPMPTKPAASPWDARTIAILVVFGLFAVAAMVFSRLGRWAS
jgi:subtilisin family serine protease